MDNLIDLRIAYQEKARALHEIIFVRLLMDKHGNRTMSYSLREEESIKRYAACCLQVDIERARAFRKDS